MSDPQNTASLAGTFSVQSRVKLPAGSLETSPPILRFLSDLTGDAPGSKFQRGRARIPGPGPARSGANCPAENRAPGLDRIAGPRYPA